MSTAPPSSTNADTCSASVTSTVSRSQPRTTAPCSSSADAIPAPMPWAVPVTSATRPARSATAPAVRDQVAHLLDAGGPHAQDVLVGTLVEPAERAVSEQLADRRRRSEEHTSELQSPCNLVCRL